MPAYSFQPQFVEPIRAGFKGGTIRAARAVVGTSRLARARAAATGGHAYPGERMALYCRQRAPSGYLIVEKRCAEVEPILLDIDRERVLLKGSGLVLCMPDRLSEFARFDGFGDFGELADFWRRTHHIGRETPGRGVFDGWHIRWLPLPKAIADV